MSLMQNTADIDKTGKQVYLITLIRESADQPMYLDQMIYESAAAGQLNSFQPDGCLCSGWLP